MAQDLFWSTYYVQRSKHANIVTVQYSRKMHLRTCISLSNKNPKHVHIVFIKLIRIILMPRHHAGLQKAKVQRYQNNVETLPGTNVHTNLIRCTGIVHNKFQRI